MEEPKRIIEGGGSELGAQLLKAARTDAPSSRSRQQALVALGLGVTLSHASTASASKLLGAKWAAGLVALGGVAVLTYRLRVGQPATPMEPAPSPPPSAPAPAQQSTAAPAPNAVQGLPEQARSTRAKVRRKPTLAQEVALLDRVREALARQDAHRALRHLRRHEKRFADGTLTVEARALRVRALELLGRDSQAAEQRRQFLKEHPNSPLSPDLRRAH